MNRYKTTFAARCPTNGVRVIYNLTIEADEIVSVEALTDRIESFNDAGLYHEEIADQLAQEFPGTHTLFAHHHGVDIETTRTRAEQKPAYQQQPGSGFLADVAGY